MDTLLGSHKAQEGRLQRPKSPFMSRHSTESAPAAFENRTPHSHPRAAFSESEELQAEPNPRVGKGRAGSAERGHQIHQSLKECKCHHPIRTPLTPQRRYIPMIAKLILHTPPLCSHALHKLTMPSNADTISKLRASDPTATTHTPPTNAVHLEPPPSTLRRPQNHPRPTPPTNSQHLQDSSTSRAKHTAAPRHRRRTPSQDRRHKHKPRHERHERHEPFVPLDPYRRTVSLIAPARSFLKQIGDWAMRDLPNREGRAPQGDDNVLEAGLRPQPPLSEAAVRAETEQLQEQLRGRQIPGKTANPPDAPTHFPPHSTSLPNLAETHPLQRSATLYPPGHVSHNLEEGPSNRLLTPEKTISPLSSKTSGKGDSDAKEMNGNSKPLPGPSPPEAFMSPKPASEPAPHHTPLLSRISPLRLPLQLPGISRPDNTKPNHPSRSYWKEIIRQIYRHLLLRLPSLYFNRVGRVFQEARMSKPDLDLLISRATATHAVVVAGSIGLGVGGGNIPTAQGGEEGRRWVSDVLDGITGTPRRSFGTPRQPSEREGFFDGNAGHNWGTPDFGPSPSPRITPLGLHGQDASQATLGDPSPPGEQWTVPHVPWTLERFKEEWENFVMGLIKEWKTLNILSALLLT